MVQQIADALCIFEVKEKTKLYQSAGYSVNISPSKGGDESEKTFDGSTADQPVRGAETASTNHLGSFLLNSALSWGRRITGWYDVTESGEQSWAGASLQILSALGGRFTPQGVFNLCVAIAIWFITWNLVAPILRWPLSDPTARQIACIRFALACVIMPVVLALITRADGEDMLGARTWRVGATLLSLKLAAAFTGFGAFAGIAVFVAIIWYYLTQAPVLGLGSGVLAALPLFFAYVATRRIALDRRKMFNGELRMHAADRLVLVVFPFFGPLLALFVFFGQWLLADRFWGPLAMLFAVGAIARMEMRGERQKDADEKKQS